MNFKKNIIIMIILTMTILLTGCWNNVDITNIAIVTAVGFDKTENGDILLTLQMVKPGIVKAKAQGSAEEPVWVYSSTGETVFSAIRNQLTTLNRKAYFSHVQLMVISEKVAREGITDVLDLFLRDKEANRMAYLLIARGITARKVLKAQSELENIPAMHIKAIIDNNKSLAKIKKSVYFDAIRRIRIRGYSLAIGVIQRQQNKKSQEDKTGGKKEGEGKLEIKDLKVEGTAIIKEGKLLGYLNQYETRGLLFIINEVKSGIINIDNPLDKGKKVAFEIVNSKGKIDVEVKNNKLKLIIEIKASGRLGEQQGKGDLTTPVMIKKMEGKVEAAIKKNIEMAVQKAQQKYHSDFFKFVKIVHGEHYQYWQSIKVNWEKIFSRAPVEIRVKWKTTSSSLLKKPAQPFINDVE